MKLLKFTKKKNSGNNFFSFSLFCLIYFFAVLSYFWNPRWVISFLFAIMLRDLTIEYVILCAMEKEAHCVKALRDT